MSQINEQAKRIKALIAYQKELLALQKQPQWEAFKRLMVSRIELKAPRPQSIATADDAIRIASQSVYQCALRDLLEELNNVEKNIQALEVELDVLKKAKEATADV